MSETTAGEIAARPRAFGIPVHTIDGQDVRAVHAATVTAVARARDGAGPSFVLAETYRFFGHHVGDVDRSYYRSKDEEERWKADRDPLALHARWLLEQGLAGDDELARVDAAIDEEVERGVASALDAPFPDPAEVTEDVYA
jgi:pyruvate dehydrogenase E1 component alpha subunit